jgi:hypothetical protein
MSSVLKNYRKIYTSPGGDPSLPPRVTILENNEYKVTYYEVIQGASGTIVVPSQGTINSDEFGLSGNAILSKIDANNKPTYESPTTVSGAAVTASLNVLTGAWVASGVYTDPNVALIYSIKIKAIYYSNLTYNNIIETIDLAVTKTSDLINDGDDGVSHFITLNDLPSNLILYATTAASDIPTYLKLVSSITDASYDAVAVDVSTGAITTTNQFISALATSANVIVGNPGVLNITTIGNIRRTSGTGNAVFYFEVWKRRSSGAESLITTSGSTLPVFNGVYSEFSASALWNDGIFLATDRIVLKFYGSRVVGGSNPTYDFQFGGSTPVRSLVPIPLTVSPTPLSELVTNKSSSYTASSTTTYANTQALVDGLATKGNSTLDNLVFSGSYMPAKLAQSAMLSTNGLSGGISAIKISGRKTCTITSLSALIATGAVGGLVRLGLYSSLNGRPNLLLADTGDLAATSAGLKEGAITPVTLQSGLEYFVCYQSTPGAAAPYVYYNAYSELNIFNTANNQYYALIYNTMTYGAYPATYPVGGNYANSQSAVIYLKQQ